MMAERRGGDQIDGGVVIARWLVPQSFAVIPIELVVEEPVLSGMYGGLEGEEWSRFLESVMRTGGCSEPVWVVPCIKGADSERSYVLWDGYQRLRAHQELGLSEIGALMLPEECVNWDAEQKVRWSRDKNEVRRHLHVVGQAEAYLGLRKLHPEMVGLMTTAEANRKKERAIRIARRCSARVQKAYNDGEITEKEAYDYSHMPLLEQNMLLARRFERRRDKRLDTETAAEKQKREMAYLRSWMEWLLSKRDMSGLAKRLSRHVVEVDILEETLGRLAALLSEARQAVKK